MKNYNRQITGMRSKVAGSLFESYIDASCRFYSEKGYGLIQKTPEPFHITRKLQDGAVQGYYEKKGQPDYKGILCDGTGIMFEAKHTDNNRILQSAVSEHQKDSLDAYAKYGAQCFVMVSIQFIKFYRVPWSVWQNMKSMFGHKYMNSENLTPYEVPFKNCLLILEGITLTKDYEEG